MPSRFFIRFSLSALRYRKQRLLLAFGALAVAAALATVMFGIYASVAQRIRDEFRAYGANLVAVAVNGGTVPLTIIDAAKREGAQAAPILVTTGHIENTIIPVAAVTASKPYWHVQGAATIAPGKCLAGELLAAQLNLQLNSQVALDNQPCTLAGIVSTGGVEDQELIVDFGNPMTLPAPSKFRRRATASKQSAPVSPPNSPRPTSAQSAPWQAPNRT